MWCSRSPSPATMMLDRFGIDVIDIGRAFDDRPEDWYDITLPDGTPVQFPTWFKPSPQPDGARDVFNEMACALPPCR